MSQSEEIRDRVSRSYAKALGGGGCCATDVPKGVTAKLAGYGAEAAGLPSAAMNNSFACGNPLAFSEVQPGQTVLDLGSGAGLDLLIAAEKVGPAGKVIGVDMTEEMLEQARANVEAAGQGSVVELRQGIIEQLPVEDASVDWVISNCVINLSPEKEKVFAEIARVLKPGGRMLISDIMVEDLPQAIRDDPRLYDTCIGGAIGRGEYLAGLEAAGLSGVEIRSELVYDAVSLKALAASELPELDTACCGVSDGLLTLAAEAMAGKVASLSVYAERH